MQLGRTVHSVGPGAPCPRREIMRRFEHFMVERPDPWLAVELLLHSVSLLDGGPVRTRAKGRPGVRERTAVRAIRHIRPLAQPPGSHITL